MVDVQNDHHKLKRRLPDGSIIFYEVKNGKDVPVYKLMADNEGFFYNEDGTTLSPDPSNKSKHRTKHDD